MRTRLSQGIGSVAVALDRKGPGRHARTITQADPELPESIRITLDRPEELLAILTENRRHLVTEVMRRPMTLSELTVSLQRDRTAVTKDVKVLERAGLVTTRREPNPGHGIRTVVRAAARRIEVAATIGP